MPKLRKILHILQFWHLPKKVWITLTLAILIVGLIFFQTRPKTAPIQYAQVKKSDIKSTVIASGTVNGQDSANLRFLTGGKLSSINVKVGDVVKKGDPIAFLDTQALAIQLQQAKNNLRNYTAQNEKAVDDIHLFQYGNGGFDNIGTPNETITQKANRTASEVARDNAVDALKAAQRAYQDATLIAPIDGIVTKSDPVAGQTVTGADLIAQIVDESAIFFDAEVDESDIGKISLQQMVEVSLNSYPDQIFTGEVAQIMPSTKTTSSGATVIVVRVNMGNPAINFVSGLNGQASIIQNQATGVLVIPQDALTQDNKVFVEKNGNVEPVPVKTGLRSDTEVQITDGLNEGDSIVLNPSAVKAKQSQGFFGRRR